LGDQSDDKNAGLFGLFNLSQNPPTNSESMRRDSDGEFHFQRQLGFAEFEARASDITAGIDRQQQKVLRRDGPQQESHSVCDQHHLAQVAQVGVGCYVHAPAKEGGEFGCDYVYVERRVQVAGVTLYRDTVNAEYYRRFAPFDAVGYLCKRVYEAQSIPPLRSGMMIDEL